MDQASKMLVPGEFAVIRYDVPTIVGDYRSMEYRSPEDPRVAQLREEFALDEVIEGCESELDALVSLNRWVRSRWNHGWSHSFSTVKDGLDILREAAGGEQFACGHYATVMVDCAAALGWPARTVALARADCEFPRDYGLGNIGHVVLELWSNDHAKWIVFDPDANVHYELDGLPLSALEIRECWFRCRDAVEIIRGQPEFVIPQGATLGILREMGVAGSDVDEDSIALTFQRFTRHDMLDYYARVTVAGWEWVDDSCLPTFVRHFAPTGTVRPTSNPDDMYWTCNVVRPSFQPEWGSDGATLTVTLEHCTPNFARYEVAINGGEWQPQEQRFTWPMREGENSLQCRTVNTAGRAGIVSRVDVSFATARW